MAKKQKRIPNQAVNRDESAKKVVVPAQVQLESPCWRFSSVDLGGPFPWPKGSTEELEILSKLHEFDSMRWTEIEGAKHHSISVDRLSRDAQKRLEEIQQNDIDELFSFRLTGPKRVFGIRLNGTVKLLWWDPEHKVCLSNLKNT
ncbi:hypothetical protein [Chromobacterium haemolyticum]|uniref:hypothetical protein n=1 Tax=Chromobacterium TaxID=535 RepID=UPI0040566AB3